MILLLLGSNLDNKKEEYGLFFLLYKFLEKGGVHMKKLVKKIANKKTLLAFYTYCENTGTCSGR